MKELKLENYESICSQSLFATGRGNTMEITAKHLERVLNLLDDSDEDAFDEIEGTPFTTADNDMASIAEIGQSHLTHLLIFNSILKN